MILPGLHFLFVVALRLRCRRYVFFEQDTGIHKPLFDLAQGDNGGFVVLRRNVRLLAADSQLASALAAYPTQPETVIKVIKTNIKSKAYNKISVPELSNAAEMLLFKGVYYA